MGQQQLLLVILVTIIVGIATVVAINVFGTASEEANRDAVRQDLMAAAAQAQGVYARPELMNGLGGDFGNTNALSTPELLQRLNIPGGFGPNAQDATVSEITNENGRYQISNRTSDQLDIIGYPSSDETRTITIEVSVDSNGNWDINWDEA